MKKVLITGISGFVGSHLAENALKNNYHVIGIDNVINTPLSRFNLSFLTHSPAFSLVQLDIRNKASVDKLISDHTPTYLFHCAALTNVRKSMRTPFEYFETNTLGTTALLEAVRKYSHHTKTILLSSSSVYGNNARSPLVEHMVLRPTSPYATSKKLMEEISQHYFLHYNLPIIILRPFSLYGPRTRPDMAPMLIIKSAETGVPFNQFGDDSTNTRDWTYIDDFTRILFKLVDNFDKHTGKIFNIGSNNPVGIESFISRISNYIELYLHQHVSVVRRTPNTFEMKTTHAEISRLTRAVPNITMTPLDTGLKRTVHFYSLHRALYRKCFT